MKENGDYYNYYHKLSIWGLNSKYEITAIFPKAINFNTGSLLLFFVQL